MQQHDQYKKEMHELISQFISQYQARNAHEGVSEHFVYLAETLCYLAKDLYPGERHKAFDYLFCIAKHDSCGQKRKAALRVLARWRRAWLDSQLTKLCQQIKEVKKGDPSFAEFPEIKGAIELYCTNLAEEREREADPNFYLNSDKLSTW